MESVHLLGYVGFCLLESPSLLRFSVIHLFSLLKSIPLYRHAIICEICVSILVLMNIWVIYSLAVMQINAINIILYMFCYKWICISIIYTTKNGISRSFTKWLSQLHSYQQCIRIFVASDPCHYLVLFKFRHSY